MAGGYLTYYNFLTVTDINPGSLHIVALYSTKIIGTVIRHYCTGNNIFDTRHGAAD